MIEPMLRKDKIKKKIKKPAYIIFSSMLFLTSCVAFIPPILNVATNHTVRFDETWCANDMDILEFDPQNSNEYIDNILNDREQLENVIMYSTANWIGKIEYYIQYQQGYNNDATNVFCNIWSWDAKIVDLKVVDKKISFEVIVDFIPYGGPITNADGSVINVISINSLDIIVKNATIEYYPEAPDPATYTIPYNSCKYAFKLVTEEPEDILFLKEIYNYQLVASAWNKGDNANIYLYAPVKEKE